MIRKETDRSILGLTQQDIALLLKVSRSWYSLSELGLRNLPSTANMRLNEMLIYMLSPEAKLLQNLPKTDDGDSRTKTILEKRLKENDFQLTVITRKINTVQEKFEKYEKAVQLMRFLNSPEQVKKATAPKALPIIESRVIKNFRESKSELDLLQIDQELLQLQKGCLQKALLKFETF